MASALGPWISHAYAHTQTQCAFFTPCTRDRSDAGDLLPVVIELKSDPDELFIAYTPKSGEALWLLAKTVFSSLGACVDLTILNAGVPGQILDDGSARARRGVICLAKPKASLPR